MTRSDKSTSHTMQLFKNNSPTFKVRATEIFATDTSQQYRLKLARIALDEMYQFVSK